MARNRNLPLIPQPSHLRKQFDTLSLDHTKQLFKSDGAIQDAVQTGIILRDKADGGVRFSAMGLRPKDFIPLLSVEKVVEDGVAVRDGQVLR
jgi:hypothetical protein